jgi:short-subunit dehydrogenase
MKTSGHGGHIVNVASMASFIPSVQAGIYATSKFAVRGLTESLRLNLAPHGIGVSLVCPGLTRTNIWQASPAATQSRDAAHTDEAIARFRELCALGMDPMEVGEKTLRGMLRNDLYVFTHPEFAEELAEIHEEVLGALPREDADPRRAAVEGERRRAKTQARELSNALGPTRATMAPVPDALCEATRT